MKLKWVSFFSLYIFPLLAMYTGNPGSPALSYAGLFSGNYPWFKTSSGYVYDYTTDKNYTLVSHREDFPNIEKVNTFRLDSNFGKIGFILVQRLELYGLFGTSEETIKWTSPPKTGFTSENTKLSADTNSHFSWTAGGKVVLLEFGCTYFGLDIQFFKINAPGKFSYVLNQLNYPFDFGPKYLILREKQISFGIARKMAFIVPYAGVTYLKSELHMKAEGVENSLYFKNATKFGIYIGGTLMLTSKLQITAEGRFINEDAFSISAITSF